MTSRPRSPRGHGGDDDDGAEPPDDESGDGGAAPRGPGARSIAEAQNWIDEAARRGRPSAGTGSGRGDANGPSTAQPTGAPVDAELRATMDRYERLGDQPPKFNIERNDATHGTDGAHTVERHGPDIPLPRDPNAKTIEGRIYGDTGWDRAENWSYRWTDPSTMNRTVRDYIYTNWEAIRSDLAMFESHEGRFDAGHRVGEGYYNSGMYGAGARAAQYATTSFVTIRVRLIPGSDPPEPFIVTAFPAGLL